MIPRALTDLLAMQPAGLPTLSTTCPYTYQVVENDTYCLISTKTGVSVSVWGSKYIALRLLLMWHIFRGAGNPLTMQNSLEACGG